MDQLKGYFARHPLENPANYRGTAFDPIGAARHRHDLRAWRERRGVPPHGGAAAQGRARGATNRLIADTP